MAETKYREILAELKDAILGARFDAEHPFPTESEFARERKLNRNTVHRAYQELRRLGLVEGGRGVPPRLGRRALSRKIGLVIPGAAYSEFFQPIVSEIARLAQKEGYALIFGNATSADPAEQPRQLKGFAQDLVREGVAGVIFQPLEFQDDAAAANEEILSVFDAAGVPVVLIDYDVAPSPARSKYDLVGINNFAAGARVAEHLLSVGARKIDFVMRPKCAGSVQARCDGVLSAVRRAGGEASSRVLVAEPGDAVALRRHLRKGRPDAFVCGNDAVAAKFKQTLDGAGLSVPGDVLLAGFDDVQIAALLTPPLTTVRQPCAAIGAKAFAALLRRLSHPRGEAQEILLSAPLVVRASTVAGARGNVVVTR